MIASGTANWGTSADNLRAIDGLGSTITAA